MHFQNLEDFRFDQSTPLQPTREITNRHSPLDQPISFRLSSTGQFKAPDSGPVPSSSLSEPGRGWATSYRVIDIKCEQTHLRFCNKNVQSFSVKHSQILQQILSSIKKSSAQHYDHQEKTLVGNHSGQ